MSIWNRLIDDSYLFHSFRHVAKTTSPREYGESKGRRYSKKNKKKGKKN